MSNIRPISDLRNKFSEIFKLVHEYRLLTVKNYLVFYVVTMTLLKYTGCFTTSEIYQK
jgi:hypothetical protein